MVHDPGHWLPFNSLTQNWVIGLKFQPLVQYLPGCCYNFSFKRHGKCKLAAYARLAA
jgi:hypothetical protein